MIDKNIRPRLSRGGHSVQGNETGAVLLTTLLIVSLIATLAIAMLDATRLSVKRAMYSQSLAQANWYVQSSEGFLQLYLGNLVQTFSSAELNEALKASKPIIYPIEGGMMAISLRDGNQCFSLGELDTAVGQSQFRRLLDAINWTPNEAARLAALASDWMDEDKRALDFGGEDYLYLGKREGPHRTANTSISGPMELRSLAGITEDAYQSVRPFLCARSSEHIFGINVDTLELWQAPLLAAVIGGDDALEKAQQLINERPAGGYTSIDMFLASPHMQGHDSSNLDAKSLIFSPQYIWAEVDVNYQALERTAVFELQVDASPIQVVKRRRTAEHKRPIIVLEASRE